MIDLLITGGSIIDGTGAPAVTGDLAVDKGVVVSVGGRSGEQARRTIDATGLAVSPGFFDMHTHYDAQWFWEPTASPSCWHGITSVLTGNCGFTLAPAGPDDRGYLQRLFSQVEGVNMDLLDRVLDWEWTSFGDYLDRLSQPGNLGINVAAQVGHSALRHQAMGADSYERAATADEIAAMAAELSRAMAAGAIGFSTLQATFEQGPYDKPVPSQLAEPDELRALADAMGTSGGGLFTVSPYPGAADISDDYQELLIELSGRCGGAVLWNAFQHRWDQPERWRDLMSFMYEAARREAPVFAVAKCQTLDLEFDLGAKTTRLFIWFPTWHETINLDPADKRARFADPSLRATFRAEYEHADGVPGQMQERARLAYIVDSPTRPELNGSRLEDVAAAEGKSLVDVMLDLAVADDLATRFVYRGLMNGDEAAVSEILNGPWCVPGVSDAGAHFDMDCGVDFTGRLLGHWVRERELLSLPDAVRRLTSMSADVLGLTDRGRLAPGQAADIVVFDADTIAAGKREWLDDVPGGGRRIVQHAIGVHQVAVNGQLLVDEGTVTEARAGQVLRRG